MVWVRRIARDLCRKRPTGDPCLHQDISVLRQACATSIALTNLPPRSLATIAERPGRLLLTTLLRLWVDFTIAIRKASFDTDIPSGAALSGSPLADRLRSTVNWGFGRLDVAQAHTSAQRSFRLSVIQHARPRIISMGLVFVAWLCMEIPRRSHRGSTRMIVAVPRDLYTGP